LDLTIGSERPKLSEIIFHGTTIEHAPALRIDSGAAITFGNTDGTNRIAVGYLGKIELGSGSTLTFSNPSASSAATIAGNLVSILGDIVQTSPEGFEIRSGDLIFNNNHGTASGGGTGAIDAITRSTRPLQISAGNISFTNNTSNSGSGAAIYANGTDANVVINASSLFSVVNNHAAQSGSPVNKSGGAFYLRTLTSAANGSIILLDVNAASILVSGNSAGIGGAIAIESALTTNTYGNIQLKLSTRSSSPQLGDQKMVIKENYAAEYGGAISLISPAPHATRNPWVYLESAGKMLITNNQAGLAGGAIYMNSSSHSLLSISPDDGGEISGNKAALTDGASMETGGAIHMEWKDEVNLYLGSGSKPGDVFRIQNNTVGTGTNQIQRAIYLKEDESSTSHDATIQICDLVDVATTIELYDGIKAVKSPSNTSGYKVYIGSYENGTFAQIGEHARAFIPGYTDVSGPGNTHKLSGGARYQTYDENSPTSFGSYVLCSGTNLAIEGTNNVLASGNLCFEQNSTLRFELGTGITPTPGGTVAMLRLEGGNKPHIGGPDSYVLPGANKIEIVGDVGFVGNYYLLDATALPDHSVATTGFLSTANLTINNNPVTPVGAATPPPPGGRNYVVGELRDHNPDAPDSKANKLYLHVETIWGNIENTWTGADGAGVWKSELSTQTAPNWSGNVTVDSGNTTPTNTFLHGDLVSFTSTAGTHDIAVDQGGVTVARMRVRDATFTFTGGEIRGSTSSSTYHTAATSTYAPLTDGMLYVENSATAIFQVPVDFHGATISNADAIFQGDTILRGDLQISGGAHVTLAAPLNITNGGALNIDSISSRLILADGGRLGTDDRQGVQVGGKSYVEFKRDTPYTYRGTISGDGNLYKTGTGTLTLAANQAYAGEFSIIGGTVVLANITQAATAVTVGENGTLAGTGQVSAGGGGATIDGKISPGTAYGRIGTLTFNATAGGDLILSSNAHLLIDISGNANDQILLAHGDIRINSDVTLATAIVLTGVGGKILKGDTHTILATTDGDLIADLSSLVGDISFVGKGTDADPDYKFRVEEFTSTQGGVTTRGLRLVTTYAIPFVPEPSTYALCGALATLALALLRPRKRQNHRQNGQGQQSRGCQNSRG
jgi:autotransporter-associated beta strand protein/predicted outer membrane repeat protein